MDEQKKNNTNETLVDTIEARALNIISAFFHYSKGRTIDAVVFACAAVCFTVAALAWGKTK